MSKMDETNLNLNEDHFNDDIFLALFRKGANEYLENDLHCEQPNEKSTTSLSEVTEKKIKNMIRHAIRKEKGDNAKKIIPKILVFASAMCIVFLVTVFSVDALRAPFLNFLVHTEEEITDIDFNTEQVTLEGESFENSFSYIPKGFELVSEEIQRDNVSLWYVDEAGGRIVIDIHYGGSNSGFDTENSQYNKIMINDVQAFYSSKNGFTNLVITKYEYSYMITSTIKLSEIIKIAENIK